MTTKSKKSLQRNIAIVCSIIGGAFVLLGSYTTVMGSFNGTIIACSGLIAMAGSFQVLDILKTQE